MWNRAKNGEVTSPLITTQLAGRIATRRETNRLFPECMRQLEFTDRELEVIEQSLRLATSMLQQRGYG